MGTPKWKSRVEMAPFAEAIGITTDSIMSASSPDRGRTWAVLFTETPTSDPDEWIYLAVLREDHDRILRVLRRSEFKTIAEFTEGLNEHMEREMRRHGYEKGEAE